MQSVRKPFKLEVGVGPCGKDVQVVGMASGKLEARLTRSHVVAASVDQL